MDKKVAVVTGASRGLGWETSRQLAEHGYDVIVSCHQVANFAEQLQASSGGTHFFVSELDVTDTASVARLASRLLTSFGHVDVLVNNAGVALDGFDERVAKETLAVNIFGAMRVTDALLPLLQAQGGRVVMVSSGLGELACVSPTRRADFTSEKLTRDQLTELMQSFVHDVEQGEHEKRGWPTSAYRVSKLGLNAFTRILARELKGSNILVNAVCPGWVRTRMGGQSATRSVDEGADTITWAATLPADGPSGAFFRDRERVEW